MENKFGLTTDSESWFPYLPGDSWPSTCLTLMFPSPPLQQYSLPLNWDFFQTGSSFSYSVPEMGCPQLQTYDPVDPYSNYPNPSPHQDQYSTLNAMELERPIPSRSSHPWGEEQTRPRMTKGNRTFQCPNCHKVFTRQSNFKSHLKTHDANRVYPFHCMMEGCKYKSSRRADVQRHQKCVHMKQRNFYCKFCPSSFPRNDNLTR